jgi:hypothetical protein
MSAKRESFPSKVQYEISKVLTQPPAGKMLRFQLFSH